MGLASAPELKPVKRVTPGGRPSSVIVACVWWGDKYGKEYVIKLRDAVHRHLNIPHKIYCLTDNEVNLQGVERYQTKHDWPGWWQKIALFQPGRFPTGSRVLYLDLDVVVCRNIDNLVCVADDFACVENFSPNRQRSAHNSSIMVWNAGGVAERIYTDFTQEHIDRLHGDQCSIWRILDAAGYEIPNFPRNDIQSFKYDSLRGKTGAQAVIFHGKPDPADVPDHPVVRDHWL
jgi:hypothetical protein